MKINSLLYEDEIVLFWDRLSDFNEGESYRIFVNGKKYCQRSVTHVEITDLIPQTEYQVQIELVSSDGKSAGVLSNMTYTTLATKKRLDVTKSPYFAKGDGKTMNTKALQDAINACKVGEAVYVPEGIYLTGALELHSDMELYLEKGAVLKGTENVEDYLPKRKSRFEGIEMMCYSSLLNLGSLDHKAGYNCKNVVIRGGGIISGGGKALARNVIETERVLQKDYTESLGNKATECECDDTIPGRARPRIINISNCQNIDLYGIRFENGPAWTVHMIYSDHIITHSCEISSKGIWNGDGWNPDSSTYCTVFDTVFSTCDDLIAIKSGKNPEGNQICRPCDNIRIFDCQSIQGGGCAIGSEMSGGISNVFIWDCDFSECNTGLSIKTTKKRGGYIRNIYAYNCTVPRIRVRTRLEFNNDGEAAPEIPIIENLNYENIHILGKSFNSYTLERSACVPIQLEGFEDNDHHLKNIQFKNIFIAPQEEQSTHSIELSCVNNVTFENINRGT